MKKYLKEGLSLALIFVLCLFLAACGSNDDEDTDSKQDETPEGSADVLYPISIGETEIRVGETTVQALLDAGFKVTVSELDENNQYTQYEIDPEMEMEPNSYYSGASIWITDSIFAHISMVTTRATKRMGDAVIAHLEFYLDYDNPEANAQISLNGVPVNEISREKAGEMFPDFTGDENMWFSHLTKEYDYSLIFGSEDKMLTKFTVEKNYDVDWNSGN